MKKNIVLIISCSTAILLLNGCSTFNSSEVTANTEDIQKLYQHTQILKKHLARTQAKTNYYERQNAKLRTEINDLRNQQAQNKRQIRVLEDQIIKMGQLQQKIAQEISALKQSMSAESKSIQNELNKIVDQVAKETATAINSLRKSQQSSRSRLKKGPIGKGKFYEHTVKKGHTLGAIAQAYGVSISEIRQANGLKSDIIRIGQKLYIPKKK